MKCTSCGRNYNEGASFKCPECSKELIARCIKCKSLNTKYKCKCGFEGP